MDLFRIGTSNFTSYIKVPDYKVNMKDVYKEWTDAAGLDHRKLVRRRVSGTFKMYFDTAEEFKNFFRTLEESREGDGTIAVSLYLNNLDREYQGSFFVDAEPSNEVPLFGVASHDGFDVTVTEK